MRFVSICIPGFAIFDNKCEDNCVNPGAYNVCIILYCLYGGDKKYGRKPVLQNSFIILEKNIQALVLL